MNVDENVFLLEATLRICNSLNIAGALKHCYKQRHPPFLPWSHVLQDIHGF